MEKLEEKLWRTLQRLTKDQFQSFKWFLKINVLEDFPGIPEAQLEEAGRSAMVDLMVQKYQSSGALKVTLEVLGKISRNDLVQDLLEASQHFKGKPRSKLSGVSEEKHRVFRRFFRTLSSSLLQTITMVMTERRRSYRSKWSR